MLEVPQDCRKGETERNEIQSLDTPLCLRNKKRTPRRGCIKLLFSRIQCFCIQTLGGTSSKLQAVWGYALSGNRLKGPLKQLGITSEKYCLLGKQ